MINRTSPAGIALLAVAFVFAGPDDRREIRRERQPTNVMGPPPMVKMMRLEIQPPRQQISHILSGPFQLTTEYTFENTLQAVAPDAGGCNGGAVVLSTGGNP